jgi:hypothetical protein
MIRSRIYGMNDKRLRDSMFIEGREEDRRRGLGEEERRIERAEREI